MTIKQRIRGWKLKPGMIVKTCWIISDYSTDVDFALLLSKTKVDKNVFKFVYLDHNGQTYSEQVDQRAEIGDIF